MLVDGVSVGAVTSYTFTNVTANHTIAASFAIDTYTITASAGAGGIIDPAGDVAGELRRRTRRSPSSRTAATTSTTCWSTASRSARSASYTFTNVTANHTISASFEVVTYTLTVTIVGNGSVTKTPDQPSYIYSTQVTLTATADPGWHFTGWSGDITGTTSPRDITVDANKNVTATFQQNVYTWNITGTGAWTTSTNWTPTRTTPSSSDVLVFDNGATTTANLVPSQTIGQLLISGNTSLTLQGSAVVSIGGGPGTDFDLAPGSSLTLNGVNNLRIALGSSATGIVEGTITLMGAQHTLFAQSPNSLEFQSGSLLTLGTGFSGTAFGTGTGTSGLNSVIFRSGAVLQQSAGSSPFGAAQPATVLTFAAGSRFKLTGNTTPSFAGRTYADFEQVTPGPITVTGSAPLVMNNLFMTSGTLNCNVTGGVELNGNVTVNSGATLNFSPASAATVTLGGTTLQTITASGTLTANANATLAVDNPAGASLATDVTLNSKLNFVVGKILTGTHVLALTGANNAITGAGSSTGYVSGKLRVRMNPVAGEAARTLEIGGPVAYAPVTIAAHGVGAAFDLMGTTLPQDHPQVASSGLEVAKTANRMWTLTPTGTPSLASYDATFGFGAVDLDPGADPATFFVRRYAGAAWSPTTQGARTPLSTQATGLTAFGDFAVGQLTQYLLTVDVVGGGTVERSPDLPTYGSGTQVQLTATAAPGWGFSGWSGDATGNTNPLTVTMTGPKTIGATFVDVEAPAVHVLSPDGGEKLLVGYTRTLQWEATDNVGLTTFDLFLSRDGGLTFPDTIATGLSASGEPAYDWMVTGPATNDGDDVFTVLLRVVAHDAAGNSFSDTSNAGCEIVTVEPLAVGDPLPTEFSLAAPWPNPARGPVRIEYAVSVASPVRLSVLDVQGREVDVLVDGARAPGRYQEVWKGHDSHGVAPAGVYFLRFRTPSKAFVRRIVLTR